MWVYLRGATHGAQPHSEWVDGLDENAPRPRLRFDEVPVLESRQRPHGVVKSVEGVDPEWDTEPDGWVYRAVR